MSDQGKWFKIWSSILVDQRMEDLGLEDFARWVKLGIYLKVNGENGEMTIQAPSRALQSLLRVGSFEAVVRVVQSLPNYVIEEMQERVSQEPSQLPAIISTKIRIKCKNWWKYQGDFSVSRTRKYREKKSSHSSSNVTAQEEKRREETRREEKNTPLTPQGGHTAAAFLKLWNDHSGDLPKAEVLSASRKRQFKARWAEKPDLAYWQSVVQKLAASEFAKKGRWATLDWVLANDHNHVKVMEGKYDDVPASSESFHSWALKYRRQRESEGLRKVPSPRQILARVRDLPDVPAPTEDGQRVRSGTDDDSAPAIRDGNPLETASD